jgi:5-formyltetrahydrofolate cyclo-ligase
MQKQRSLFIVICYSITNCATLCLGLYVSYQLIENILTTTHDIPMDIIITEQGIYTDFGLELA